MRVRTSIKAIMTCLPLLSFTLFGFGGCGSFNPLNYFSRNACDFLNCEVLFFVDDMFPLSAGPIGSTGSIGSAGAAAAEDEEEGGGHLH